MSGRFRVEGWSVRGSAAGLFLVLFLFLAVPFSGADDTEETVEGTEQKAEEEQPAERCRPAPRFQTLEDIYGDTGEFFQAGVGLLNFEKADADHPDPLAGYGLGIDDMVVEWREFNLVGDTTTCALGGKCAVIDLQGARLYEGSALVNITVLERTPPTDNDCDFDDVADGTTDCDSDGVNDVPVKMTTEAEVDGEIVFANLAAGSTEQYVGKIAISILLDVDGVLFAQSVGNDLPTVTALYMDLDDGTGQPCSNDVNPALQGRIESSLNVIVVLGEIVVENVVLGDNGDDDGWADTHETVEMQIVVGNKTGLDLSGVNARLMTGDPKIDCVLDGALYIGDIPADGSVLSTETFVFRVADVQREGTCSIGGNVCTSDVQCVAGGGDSCDAVLIDFSAEFTVNLASDEFDAATAPQTVTLDLDLDASAGSGPGMFYEGFESGNFGAFTTMNLDEGLFGSVESDGYRCQYNDPDFWYSNSYETSDCWLGASAIHADKYWWQVADGDAAEAPVGRSFEGRFSAYMGLWDANVSAWTTPMAILEALSTEDPVNIGWDRVCQVTRTQACSVDADCVPPVCPTCNPSGEPCVGVTPELSFKHQISLVNWRGVSSPFGESADGGAVAVQLAAPESGGTPVGDWFRIEPYVNIYDEQRTDQYTNCFFDPIDDGNTEDDYFDPSDPRRRLGPSTLCFPEFVFVHLGDTDSPFSADNIGNASDGPGLEGNRGDGTWVESKFSLQRFRGRSLRLRFVHGSVKASSYETFEAIFAYNPSAVDDGWWVDGVTVTDTLLVSATLSVDVKPNTGLPGCGALCTTLTADLSADTPGALPAPGQAVNLSAVASSADRCLDGTLQFRFWADGDTDGLGGSAADQLLRGWTDNPVIALAPAFTTDYVVDVRCSALPACADSASLQVVVQCPETGLLLRALGGFNLSNPDDDYKVGWIKAFGGYCSDNENEGCTVSADCEAGTCLPAASGELLLSWPPGPAKGRRVLITRVEVGEGADFDRVKANGDFVPVYSYERLVGRGFRDPIGAPPPGSFRWYLMTHDDPGCNIGGSWQTGDGAEPGRDDDLP